MKLSAGLEKFKGVVSDDLYDLSFAAVEIDKSYWLALPQWRNLCHKLSCDQPQTGSFFQRPREAEKRDPGNEVGPEHGAPKKVLTCVSHVTILAREQNIYLANDNCAFMHFRKKQSTCFGSILHSSKIFGILHDGDLSKFCVSLALATIYNSTEYPSTLSHAPVLHNLTF